MDWTTMTDDELAAAITQARTEEQRRSRDRRLLDQAHTLVLEARNAGFTQAEVTNALTKVVRTYYPAGGA